jgi:3-phytase/alkaline phosphatase D
VAPASAVVLFLLTGPVGGAKGQTLPQGVAAGDTTQTSTVLWAASTAIGPIRFEYATDPDFRTIVGSVTSQVVDSRVPVKVDVAGLVGGMQYYYRVTNASGATAAGRFRTPAGPDEHRGLRFGVSGDWRGELAPYPAIANLPQRDLDFFVALGDTIYADYPTPAVPKPQAETLEDFRLKHAEVYSERFGVASWREARASTSLLACIDDHEVTNDFAGGAPSDSDARFEPGVPYINETSLFENGLRAFGEYNPIRDEYYGDTGDRRTADKRKLYRYRTWGSDAAVLMLDTRSFRDEELKFTLSDFSVSAAQQFLVDSFTPERTLLGAPQMEQLKADLLEAQAAGLTWKFIVIPEPIQNLGPIQAADRYEGYAFERAQLLGFIHDNDIPNVVFIAADIHSTIVNNLTYQVAPDGPQIPMSAFEITTGAVAFDPPFGPIVTEHAMLAGAAGATTLAIYDAAPTSQKDSVLRETLDVLLGLFGYDAVGLDGSGLDVRLRGGDYVALHTYGWTEFEVEASTQKLTVTTYGIDAYSESRLLEQTELILRRRPRVVSRFSVQPSLTPAQDADGDGVLDASDLCADTPRPEFANSNGCSCTQLDGDNDGVVDCYDRCPATVPGQRVSADGCALSDSAPPVSLPEGSEERTGAFSLRPAPCGAIGMVGYAGFLLVLFGLRLPREREG